MTELLLKCRKCRRTLNEDCKDCVVSAHNEPLTKSYLVESCVQQPPDVIYIQENNMPMWIKSVVNERGWLKGKLVCPYCSARLGSFDFVSGLKCHCNKLVLPPVHLVKSKVDYNLTT